MNIDTRLKLITYVRKMLGAPQIEIEVSDDQISQIISDTIQLFTEIAYGTLEATAVVQFKGKGDYKMPPTITNIIKVSKGNFGSGGLSGFSNLYGSDLVPDMWSEQFFTSGLTGNILQNIIVVSNLQATMDKYFGDDIYYNFNPHKKVLQVFEPFNGIAMIHYNYEYIPDEVDEVYNQMWVKRMCVAKTKLLWGSIIGKYSGTLVGGATINYADIKSDAQSEIDKLEEELKERWEDPAPVMVC